MSISELGKDTLVLVGVLTYLYLGAYALSAGYWDARKKRTITSVNIHKSTQSKDSEEK